MVSTSSSTVPVSRHTGTASTPAKCLNSTALPSITGNAASGPISPRPSTAVPSVITATVLPRAVYRAASDGSVAMARETSATPGVYSRARSARSRNALVGTTSLLPPSCTRNAGSAGSKLNDTGYDGLAVMVKITCSTGAGTPEGHHLHAGRSQGVGYINASRGVSRRHICSHIKAPLNTEAVRVTPVSYTHLRAHETVLDLVCRLLLEKKKKK